MWDCEGKLFNMTSWQAEKRFVETFLNLFASRVASQYPTNLDVNAPFSPFSSIWRIQKCNTGQMQVASYWSQLFAAKLCLASTWIRVISFLSEASRQNKCISYSQETVRVREASPNIKPCLFGHCPNGGVETLAQMVCGSSSVNKMHQKCCQHHGYQNALVCHGLLLSAIVRLGCCWLGPTSSPCTPLHPLKPPCTPLQPLQPLHPLHSCTLASPCTPCWLGYYCLAQINTVLYSKVSWFSVIKKKG